MRSGLLLALLAACGGGGPGFGFVKPAPGENFVRDGLGPTGALSALVGIDVDFDDATRIALAVGPRTLDLDASGDGTLDLRAAGAYTLTATAFDGDTEIATDSVDITVTDPQLATCRDALDLYKIDYSVTGATQGVEDPVTARMPINGVPYRVSGNMNPRMTMLGDCRLIRSLAEAAPFFRDRQITEVTDMGVYNYRCIGGGTPPNCPNGISQHAYAMAIDLAGFTTADGTFFSVNDDWIIDPNTEDTCDAPTIEGKDRFLHELICDLKAANVWNIVLTPNYNADHRNHFHVDLTPSSDFIERRTEQQHFH